MIAQRRDKNEPEIIEALRAAGCHVIRMDRLAGFDLLVCKHNRSWIMEVKTPGKEGDTTPAEDICRNNIEHVGGKYYIVTGVDDALAITEREVV